jgi:Domain of unknown function (DUF4157)
MNESQEHEHEEGSPPRRPTRKESPRKDRPSREMPGSVPEALRPAGNAALGRVLEPDRPGRPLDPGVRARLERSFGTDLGRVRLHEEPGSRQAADALDAGAVAHGTDIHLGPGAPPLDSPAGSRLLAHEVAHVVQQDAATAAPSQLLSRSTDAAETSAARAADIAVSGGSAAGLASSGTPVAAVQRQEKGAEKKEGEPAGGPLLLTQTQVETAVSAFLNRCWHQQSKGEKPFRITPAVREGLGLVFSGTPAGIATVASDLSMEPGTPGALMEKIRSKLPASVDGPVIEALGKLPSPEKAKEEKIEGPKPSKDDDPAVAAIKEAARRFLDTEAGSQLARTAKEFAFSKEGIPLLVWVAGGVITFIAANDPRLPGLPEFDIGGGIKLKVDIGARASEVPPLVRQLLGGETIPPPEPGSKEPAPKVSIGLSGNIEDIPKFLAAVGDFFVAVGTGIAAGVVWAGRAIVLVGKTILPELLATLGGAAAGALIGLAAGGGVGAAIGAAIGAGVGLVGALIGRLVKHLREPKKT